MFLEIAFLHFIILFEFGFYLSKAVWYFPRKEVSQTFIDRDVYPGFDGFTFCLSFFSKESFLISEKLEFKVNSVLLHSGLNPAWHFWLSTRFSCCLKMKSVENILGYIREQFYRFSRGCKPQENLWNCSRKYPKMFKTDFIFRQRKIEFQPECQAWSCYYATGCFVHFWVICFLLKWGQNIKKSFCCLPLWTVSSLA